MKEQDKNKHIIKQAGIEKPQSAFLNQVMGKVEEEASTERVADKAWSELLQQLPPETPSKGFHAAVMHSIAAETGAKPAEYEPVFSKKVWYGFAAVIVGITVMGFMGQPAGHGSPTFEQFYKRLGELGEFSSDLELNTNMSAALAISLVVVSVLFVATDWFPQKFRASRA